MAESSTKLSMELHAECGIFGRQLKVSKQVLDLHSTTAMGLAINFWRKTLLKELRDKGKNELAAKLSDELSDFRNELENFYRLTIDKSVTSCLMDDSITDWCDSNDEISLRQALPAIAKQKLSEYLISANQMQEKKKLAFEKAKPSRSWTSQGNPNWTSQSNAFTTNRGVKRFADKTPEGKPICRSFNRGSCTLRFCNFEHLCNVCLRGKHPGVRCLQRFSQNQPKAKNETQTATNKD